MAALLTSVIDNNKKVSEYILTCRSMGIELLPPDINQGEAGFSVSGGSIRYALTAIKGVGRPVIDSIVEERRARGNFTTLKDFITRMADTELNKRVIESFIKAGALDGLNGNRRQFMSVYVQLLDHVTKDKKNNLAGQISLFDIAGEEQKDEFDLRMPNVNEYPKEMKLAFEKEVLGIYISGHPMEEYQELWRQNVTHNSNDFALDEETGVTRVGDQTRAVVGGMIAAKTVKYTKNDQMMAFVTLEDLVGSVEVVVFPRDYDRYGALLTEDSKVFIRGRASVEEDKDGKLICEEVLSFEDVSAGKTWNAGRYRNGGNNRNRQPSVNGGNSGIGANGGNRGNSASSTAGKMPAGIWIQFPDMAGYESRRQELLNALADSHGDVDVVIYLRGTKEIKLLPPNLRVAGDETLLQKLSAIFGEENVRRKNF
jgi:DNA polymerase-3 subunit alpha